MLTDPDNLNPADPPAANTPKRSWRRRLRAWPPERRRAWLANPDVARVVGTATARALLAELEAERAGVAALVPSPGWLVDWWHRGVELPTGMVLGRAKVATGDGPQTHRLTPGPAVELEDYLDLMTHREAAEHDYPISVSASAIIKIADAGGRELRQLGRWR